MQLSVKEKLLKYVRVNEQTGCWEWKGGKRHNGYGAINIDGKVFQAHRVSYTEFVGDIGSGMMVCHKCDNPPCINPDHLFVGTGFDNMQDCIKKGRFYTGSHIGFCTNRKRGEHAHNAKLTDQEVREIRKSTEIYKVLAKKYGVSICLIHNVKFFKRWAHVV